MHTVHVHKEKVGVNPLLLAIPVFIFFLIVFYYVTYVRTSIPVDSISTEKVIQNSEF